MEEQEVKQEEVTNPLDLTSLGFETEDQLKEVLEKGRQFDEYKTKYEELAPYKEKYESVAGYKDKYGEVESFLQSVGDPSKLFADGEVGLKREALRAAYPFVSAEVASKLSDPENMSPVEALAVAQYLKTGGKYKYSSVLETVKEELDIDPDSEPDEKDKLKMEIKAGDAREYIKKINGDVKIPELKKFADWKENITKQKEASTTELTKLWQTSVGELKSVITSKPVEFKSEVEIDGEKYSFNAPMEMTEEDVASLDGAVSEMVNSGTVVTKEILASLHSVAESSALMKKFPQILGAIYKQGFDSAKNKFFTNPNMPNATDKPTGAETVNSTEWSPEKHREWAAKGYPSNFE